MSRQLGSLHRSNSHPTKLNTPITIIPLFAFPPPDFPTSNITSGMNSDTNSHISVLYSISQLNNPNIETPDELQTLNHLRPILFKPTPQLFQHPLFNQSHQITIHFYTLLRFTSHPNLLFISFRPIIQFSRYSPNLPRSR